MCSFYTLYTSIVCGDAKTNNNRVTLHWIIKKFQNFFWPFKIKPIAKN